MFQKKNIYFILLNRSTRAASFAIPSNATIIEFIKKTAEPITNKFMLAPPSASTINIRRHSLQQCQNANEQNPNPANNGESPVNTTLVSSPPMVPTPPPIPKRTFLGKIIAPRSSTDSSPTSSIKTTITNMCRQSFDEVKRRNASSKPAQSFYQSRRVENHYPIDQYSDDDRLSIESSIFEEPKSSDPIMFAASSNRSSSDSNKSHITNDTGYMSASNDTDRIFFGASEDFRSRFSSVDTQSSLDSCTSSDLQIQQQHQSFNIQNQTRCIISPLAAKTKRDDSEDNNRHKSHSKKLIRMNSSNSMLFNNLKSVSNNIGPTIHETTSRLPPVPLRKQPSTPKLIPTNFAGNNKNYNITTATNTQSRGRPPPPPTRSLDSGRILYNGSMLGAFQSGLAKITSAAANTSDVVMGRKSFKRSNSSKSNNIHNSNINNNNNNNNINTHNNNSAIYNQKQHHVKLNQRQDSSISSDSFSLTSSPGYNTKNMEAPLLQHASKINKTNYISSSMKSGRATIRQDSSLSSESFSQTSSPGYNIKLLDQPISPHISKLHACKWYSYTRKLINTISIFGRRKLKKKRKIKKKPFFCSEATFEIR